MIGENKDKVSRHSRSHSPASPSLASLWIFARYSDGESRARECGLLDFVNPEGKKNGSNHF